jgi:thiamine pyrophosphokinase
VKAVILLSGPVAATPRLQEQLKEGVVIAADGGMAHAEALRLAPILWVGDFDSSPPELQARYAHIPRQTHPTDKDHTDAELAIRAALEQGASELVLVGALGGQTDHALTNLTLGLRLAQQGIGVMLSSGLEEAYPLLPGELELDIAAGSRFSIVPLDDLGGLSIGGAKWELDQAAIRFGSTQTQSNSALGPVKIRLLQGHGLVVCYPAT